MPRPMVYFMGRGILSLCVGLGHRATYNTKILSRFVQRCSDSKIDSCLMYYLAQYFGSGQIQKLLRLSRKEFTH